jgi:hypothetical protein
MMERIGSVGTMRDGSSALSEQVDISTGGGHLLV